MTASANPPSTQQERSTRRLDLLLDVPLDLTVELGRTRMCIQDLLALGPGSVIELDKIAGEPLDILVNERLIARGEAVVVNDKFGVRITDIVSPSERIARLR
jgi:flagellar motor switch protein FliN